MTNIIVCGGGSAGCIVAARLSEDPHNSVLLLEGGPDYLTVADLPEDVRNAWVVGGTKYDWGYLSEDRNSPAPNHPNFAAPAPESIYAYRGKVIGGSSSTNATNATRPPSIDFDQWEATGATDWSWTQVLPAFRALETDMVGGDRHGTAGPIPITRFGEQRPIFQDFLNSCAAAGYPANSDLNGSDRGGAGPLPLNQSQQVRISANVGFLTPENRNRTNLEIRGDTLVDRVEFENGRACAVVLADGERLSADLIVLSTGALSSPGVLMRSGIGPTAVLEEFGIDIVIENEAVGRNLRDHPMVYPTWSLKKDPGAAEPPLSAILAFSSVGHGRPGDIDLHAVPITPSTDSLVIALGLLNPFSLGRFTIRSKDPNVDPKIHFNVFDHPEDLQRLTRGIQLLREIVTQNPLSSWIADEIWPGSLATGDGAVAEAILSAKNTYAHATSTCSMGSEGTPWAVVDQYGKVHGVSGLYVIDASIMPRIPRVPTNMTTMMLAERCVSSLRSRITDKGVVTANTQIVDRVSDRVVDWV